MWYCKRDLCEMAWPQGTDRMKSCVVAGAAFGGPIATVRNDKVFRAVKGSIQTELQTFTATGQPLGSLPWHYPGLVHMAWTDLDILVCVFSDGVLRTFSPFCESVHFFTIDEQIKQQGGVIQATVSNGVVALVTAKLQVFVNLSVERPLCIRLADPNLKAPPLAMCLLVSHPPPLRFRSASGGSSGVTADEKTPGVIGSSSGRSTGLPDASLLLAPASAGPLLLCRRTSVTPVSIRSDGGEGPYVSLALSRRGTLIAALSSSGAFKVLSAKDIESGTVIDSARIEVRRKPTEVAWVGDDCLAVSVSLPSPSGESQHCLYVGGPASDWLPFQYSSPVHLVAEADGARVISASKAETLQRVSEARESIFAIGSTEAPAMLCYSYERYRQGEAAADESLRSIRSELEGACEAALLAAAEETDHPDRAAVLLNAAVFGAHFLELDQSRSGGPASASEKKAETATGAGGAKAPLPSADSPEDARQRFSGLLAETVRDVRVCTALRQSPIWIPISVAQLRYGTLPVVVQRLMRRRCHLVALRIAEYAGLARSAQEVLEHWGCERVRAASDEESDDAVASQVVAKLRKEAGRLGLPVSFSAVAQAAAKAARPRLATLLVGEEPVSAPKVRMLLKLASHSSAVSHAVGSRDPDLVLECIAALDSMDARAADGVEGLERVAEAVRDLPLASDLFAVFCRRTGQWDRLRLFLEMRNRLSAAGGVTVERAVQRQSVDEQRQGVALALGLFGSHRGSGEGTAQFAHAASMEQIDLLDAQSLLEQRARQKGWRGTPKFVGLSLHQTLRSLICRGEVEEADRMRKNFKVSDSRYWRIKLDALADSEQFDELRNFAFLRSSPVGYEPFLRACERNGALGIAAALVPKLKDQESRDRWAERLGGRQGGSAAGVAGNPFSAALASAAAGDRQGGQGDQGGAGNFFQQLAGFAFRRGGS